MSPWMPYQSPFRCCNGQTRRHQAAHVLPGSLWFKDTDDPLKALLASESSIRCALDFVYKPVEDLPVIFNKTDTLVKNKAGTSGISDQRNNEDNEPDTSTGIAQTFGGAAKEVVKDTLHKAPDHGCQPSPIPSPLR